MANITRLDYTPTDDGREPQAVEIRETIIHLATEVPGWVMLELGTLVDNDNNDSSTVETMTVMRRVVLAMIKTSDRETFEQLLTNADPVIGVNELMTYINAMMEIVSGRPTEGQQSSDGSLPETPTESTDGTAPEAVTQSEGSAL